MIGTPQSGDGGPCKLDDQVRVLIRRGGVGGLPAVAAPPPSQLSDYTPLSAPHTPMMRV